MSAPLDYRDLTAGVEELERRSPRASVATQSEEDPEDPIAKFARLLAQREGSCGSFLEPPDAHPLKTRKKSQDWGDGDVLDKFEALLRTDSAAIKTETKDVGRRASGGASSKAATSNALPRSTNELKARRRGAKTVVSEPVGLAHEGAAPRRSLYVRVGVVVIGLASLGAGMAFWRNASSPLGASAIKTQAEAAKRLSQGVSGGDSPARGAAVVAPSPAAPAGGQEQPLAASPPLAKAPSAIAPRDEDELASQTATAPIPPAPTQTQAEPVGVAASPAPEKAETLSAAPLIGGIHPSDAPPQAAPNLMSPRGTASVAPPGPKTEARSAKAAKLAVAGKLDSRSHPGQIVKPAKAIARETVGKPDSTQPPLAETEAPAPKPAAQPEADEPFAYFSHAQEAADSLSGVVRNLVGTDAASRP